MDASSSEQEVIRQAFVVVLATDVISHARKRIALARLEGVTGADGCPTGGCGTCQRRRRCEEAVQEIMATA